MPVIKNKFLFGLLVSILTMLLFVSFNPEPLPAVAEGEELIEITGDGVANPGTFTREQLEDMEQSQQVYSVVNTWPTKKWYVGQGVKLCDLLDAAEIKDDARLIKFTSNDGYTITLTIKELFMDPRYCFPHFKDENTRDGDGNIAGSGADPQPVEAIVALIGVEGSDNPAYMSDLSTPVLMVGQRAVTEQTGNLFVKYLSKIEVLTGEPSQWDAPQANPGSGMVRAGTMIALSNANMDDDKIYYTTDGSTPTMNSTMYNWIAKRWWSSRANVLGDYNKPIGPINENIAIKAITIGPGKLDSEVAVFTYTIAADEEPAEEPHTVRLTDIDGHWAQDNIEALAAAGCAGGYPDGSFKPDNTITRAEFAVMLVKAFGIENRNDTIFADTAAHWAKDSIAAAAGGGIVNGYDADTFGPDDLITREQMAVMVFKAAQLPAAGEETNFADGQSISSWARQAAAAAVANGIMNGYLDNTLQPQGKASRAEAATVIIKALNR